MTQLVSILLWHFGIKYDPKFAFLIVYIQIFCVLCILSTLTIGWMMYILRFLDCIKLCPYFEGCSYKHLELKWNVSTNLNHAKMQFLHKKATSETGQDLQLPLWWNQFMLQLNLCEKLLFLHPLTHKMTTDCSLNYKFNTWKFQAQIWGENVVYRNCFWHPEQVLYTTCSPPCFA